MSKEQFYGANIWILAILQHVWYKMVSGQIPTGQIPTGQLPPLQNTPWTYTHQFFLKIKILNKYTLLFLTFHLVVGICPGGILQGG